MAFTSTQRVDLQRTVAESDIAGCSLTEDDIDTLIDLFEAWSERQDLQDPWQTGA